MEFDKYFFSDFTIVSYPHTQGERGGGRGWNPGLKFMCVSSGFLLCNTFPRDIQASYLGCSLIPNRKTVTDQSNNITQFVKRTNGLTDITSRTINEGSLTEAVSTEAKAVAP